MGSIGSIANMHYFGRIREQAIDDTFKSIYKAIKRILILDKEGLKLLLFMKDQYFYLINFITIF